MFRASQLRAHEAIATQAIIKRFITQSKSIELPSSHAIFLLHERDSGGADRKSCGSEVAVGERTFVR